MFWKGVGKSCFFTIPPLYKSRSWWDFLFYGGGGRGEVGGRCERITISSKYNSNGIKSKIFGSTGHRDGIVPYIAVTHHQEQTQSCGNYRIFFSLPQRRRQQSCHSRNPNGLSTKLMSYSPIERLLLDNNGQLN